MSTAPAPATWDLTRILLAVVSLGGLIAASFWILRPFLPSVVWATMIVVATWPALRRVQGWLWGRRSLAVIVMTLVMLAIIAVPLTVAIVTIVDRSDDIVAWIRSLPDRPLPALPDWLTGLPVVGPKLAAEWQKIVAAGTEDLTNRVSPYLAGLARWLIGQAGSLGALLIQMLLTVVISAILYAQGESVAAGVLAFARRLAGENGPRVVILSGGAIRGVAFGIVGTALVQSIIGGIGLFVTGVPHPLLLTSIMFFLAVAQIGPIPVMLGSVIWLYSGGQTAWWIVLLIWSLLTGSLDNVLRPLLIRRGADLPFLLILSGVLGGMLAFGLIGLFVGPVLLAVTYTLLSAWVEGADRPQA